MRRLITIALISLCTMMIYAESDLLITKNEKTIGTIYPSKNEIKATEIIFPERIENSFIDTTSNNLTIQLRGTSKNKKWLNNSGNLVLYNLASDSTKWVKKIYYLQGYIEQYNNCIIQSIGNKSYCLDIENGENLWEVKNTIIYVDPIQKIGIGYKFKASTGYTNSLEGIDLTNGNTRWKREINREYSWNEMIHLNDSIVIIAAAGLHSINLKNGKGWDYNTVTGEKDYSTTIAANAVGAAVGILTGTFVMSSGHDLVRNIVSNILVDSANIYFASKDQLASLDYNGLINWTSSFPKDLASKSSIFIKDSTLYMINMGFANMGNRQVTFGSPFIARFNKKNGKQISLSLIENKNDQINGYNIDSDTIYLIYKDKIAKYSLSGSLLNEKSFENEPFGELEHFVSKNQVFIKTDSLYKSLSSLDSTKQYIFTKSGKTLVINDKLEIVKQIDYNEMNVYYLRSENFKFLSKANKTTVIDNMNRKVADIDISGNAFLIGNKLYDIQQKSFIEMQLSELMKN